MSDSTKCIAEIQEAAGGELTDAQLQEAVDLVEDAKALADAKAEVGGNEQVILQNLQTLAEDKIIAAKVEKRNAALNAIKTKEMLAFVNTNFPKNPVKGFEALLVGVQELKSGGRYSTAARQNSLRDEYVSGAIHDFHSSGLQSVLNSGAMDRDIARALWDIDAEVPTYAGKVPKEAKTLAGIIHKWQEKTRVDANRAGALIGKMQGYIVRQSHDRGKISRADPEVWKSDIISLLDKEKTFAGKAATPEAQAKVLDNLYRDLASGVHLDPSKPPLGLKGVRNVGKTMSHQRTIHFKDADAFFTYNEKYGKGNLREAFLGGLMANAEKTAMMRTLGPNAELNIQRAASAINEKIDDPKLRANLDKAINEDGRLYNQMRLVSGMANTPVHETAASISAVARGLQSLTKLGGSVLSAFTDVGTMANTLADNSSGFLGSMGTSVKDIVGSVGGSSKDRLEVAHSIGIFADSMIGDIGARMSGRDDLPGSMSRYMQTFFKFNGLTWWTDSARRSAGLMLANNLQRSANMKFDKLGEGLQRNLTKYGIDENSWDVVRSTKALTDDKGNGYLTPANIDKLDDAIFARVLEKRGDKASPYNIRELKTDLTDRLRTYITDQAEHAVIVPDKKTQFYTLGGTRPGTLEGELRRFVAQFKQFPAGILQKTMGSTLFGRGYEYDQGKGVMRNALKSMIQNGNGERAAMARLMTTMTLLGYVAMSAKDLAKGKEPRDPRQGKTWIAAMVQGGGLGIYGDFIFGEMRNRFGGGLISTFAGPTAGSLNQLADVYGRMKEGEDASAAAFKALVDHTPLIVNDLFYTKPVLDYLIMYDIQETINPGYLNRMESRQARDNETKYWLSPAQDRLQPIGAM